MCGINGLFSRTNSFDLASTGSRMNALIQHRGPDDEGSVVFGKTEGCPLGTPKSVSKDHTINYLDFKNDVQEHFEFHLKFVLTLKSYILNVTDIFFRLILM